MVGKAGYLYELVGGKVHNVMVSTADQAIIFDDYLNGVKLGIRMDGNNHAIRTCRKDPLRTPVPIGFNID